MKNAAQSGKPYAGNPHVRFEVGGSRTGKPRRGSLLYNTGKLLVGRAVSLICGSVLAALLSGCAAMGGENALTAQEKAEGYELLFDGVNLPTDKWVGVKSGCTKFPEKGWFVNDGSLAMRPLCVIRDGKCFALPPEEQKLGGGGDICTKKTYGDFCFKFDFRLTEAANSGVKYFFDEKANGGTCEEYQLLDPAHPDSQRGRGGNRCVAALYDIIPANAEKFLKPLGQWNSGMIVSRGRHVEHWLNGVKMLEYERGSAAFRAAVAASKYANWGTDGRHWGELEEGRILLQDHGDSKVSFRNLKVKEL